MACFTAVEKDVVLTRERNICTLKCAFPRDQANTAQGVARLDKAMEAMQVGWHVRWVATAETLSCCDCMECAVGSDR